MTTTSIEWTRGDDGAMGETWNPIRGCSILTEGCRNCYAMKQAHRFSGKGAPYEGLTVLGKHGPRWTGEARFVREMLELPLKWRKPRRVFTNSMADLFHVDITNEQIATVFAVMAACPQHTFMVLTKRADRMVDWFRWLHDEGAAGYPNTADEWSCLAQFEMSDGSGEGEEKAFWKLRERHGVDNKVHWPLRNVWLGVSVEDQQRADERVPLLLEVPAAVRFISAEPLLGPIVFDPTTLGCVGNLAATFGNPLINWVIVGGESGPGARPCDLRELLSVVEQCQSANVPVFCKQLGARPFFNDRPCKVIDRKGGDIGEFPEELRVRQFPEVLT